MWPLSTRVKRSRISRRRLADRHRARHIGGAVEILRARIEQIEGARFEAFLGLRHRPVVDDRTVRARTGYRRKAQIAEMLAVAPDRLEPVAGGDLAEPALWRLAREPGEKARQRRAVAAMRRPRAVELDRVLARLGQEAGIGGAVDLRARRVEPIEDPGGGGRRDRPEPGRLRRRARRAPGRARSGGMTVTALPRWRSRPGTSLRRSMNKVTLPSCRRIAKDSGSGVCGTSPPRMLRSQAIDSGHRQHRGGCALPRPERARAGPASTGRFRRQSGSACGTTGAIGAAGRPDQTRSSGFSATARNAAPAFSAAARNRSTSCGVCSQGRSRAPRRGRVPSRPNAPAAPRSGGGFRTRGCRPAPLPAGCSGHRRRAPRDRRARSPDRPTR